MLSKYAKPIIEGIVRSTLGQPVASDPGSGVQERQDADDIVGDVNLRILDRLRRLKESRDKGTITDFRRYVSAAAGNACNAYLRRKYPNRVRLKNKLFYVLMRQRDFAVWEDANGRLFCGFYQWQDHNKRANRRWVTQARMDPGRPFRAPTHNIIDLLREIFTSSKAPLHLEDLVNRAAEILQVRDLPPSREVEIGDPRSDNISYDDIDPPGTAANRLYFERLWNEILQLPLTQRVALLLAVKEVGRTNIPNLFSELGIASFHDIATAIGMPGEEFTLLLNDLPLDDGEIGKRLGISRKQVGGCRLSARRRLARRMRSWAKLRVIRGPEES